MKGQTRSFEKLYKAFIYVALITLAISIIVPVGWVFLASIKENREFYGSPWTLPEGFYWQNFLDAWNKAKMGDYLLNSVIVTALALVILVVVAIPSSYVLARYKFPGSRFVNSLLKGGLFINVNYIVVPIFLMLLDWDKGLKGLGINGFFLNNIFVLAVVYAATSLPFTIYLLSNFFKTLPTTFEYIIALTLMPGKNQTLPVGLKNLLQAQRGAAEYGQMYAGMVIVMLPTLILYILVQNKLTQGMTLGGSKE